MKFENSGSPDQQTEEDSEFEVARDVEDIAQDNNEFTLFVDNVPEDVTKQEIRSVFEKHGIVIGVKRPKTKKKKKQEEYEDNSCCFVTFGSKEEANKAVEVLNGSHTFSGSYSPINVGLCSRRTGNVTLNDCFKNLERFSFEEHVDPKQEQLRRHMMSMGHMAAESLFSIARQAKKDGILPKDSALSDMESGNLTVDNVANLIMKPLDGMPLPKGKKTLENQKERKNRDVGMVKRQLPEKLEGKRIPSKEKKGVEYIKKKQKMDEEKKGSTSRERVN